jgi:hypothetical protein
MASIFCRVWARAMALGAEAGVGLSLGKGCTPAAGALSMADGGQTALARKLRRCSNSRRRTKSWRFARVSRAWADTSRRGLNQALHWRKREKSARWRGARGCSQRDKRRTSRENSPALVVEATIGDYLG